MVLFHKQCFHLEYPLTIHQVTSNKHQTHNSTDSDARQHLCVSVGMRGCVCMCEWVHVRMLILHFCCVPSMFAVSQTLGLVRSSLPSLEEPYSVDAVPARGRGMWGGAEGAWSALTFKRSTIFLNSRTDFLSLMSSK